MSAKPNAKPPLLISSSDNPKVKELIALREKRERDKTALFLIEGYRELLRATDAHVTIEKLFICPELFLGTNEQDLIERVQRQGATLIECTEKVFQKVSYRDRPDGLLAIAKTMHYRLSDLEKKLPKNRAPLLVIAVGIEKPGNLGTILRSSDSAGADGVIVCDRCTDIYNPNVVRASVGTLFTLPVIETSSQEAISWLEKLKIKTVATTPSTDKLYSDVNLKEAVAIVVGTEQIGLSDLWLHDAALKVKIPMLGVADSLNVAMATTILLYEAIRQRSHGH
jgi:RNA methyltransferase, TrmH family